MYPLLCRTPFGDSGRNILDGPPYRDWSVALIKDSPVSEALNLQFRAELFNSLNRPNFDLPDIFLGALAFARLCRGPAPDPTAA